MQDKIILHFQKEIQSWLRWAFILPFCTLVISTFVSIFGYKNFDFIYSIAVFDAIWMISVTIFFCIQNVKKLYKFLMQ